MSKFTQIIVGGVIGFIPIIFLSLTLISHTLFFNEYGPLISLVSFFIIILIYFYTKTEYIFIARGISVGLAIIILIMILLEIFTITSNS